ncbi:SDR family oxidoreductase [Pseudomonas sp. TH05]|uniref:SDR family oxidoreductase n=1 Tax=unclassified Pseudomonas TaxID=196821 RepID=UPI001913EC3D|nr:MULTISPECIES: SDR family oxidoreductase [unclassified Pseudomonas]MBK5542216.1 SDR family oxidoreductase [Pseudomonas sp. TH07]MBK5559612.1 SDR family oxidoreductase [Pseudomonas sp. TH05]
MIAITGATGQLGRLVIDALLQRVPASEVLALVRDPLKARDLTALGVTVRQADYSQPQTLATALAGVERLLLISSNEIGQRTAQHLAVIDAAKAAGVKLLAYTSVLRADTSALGLAAEHLATEQALSASGLDHVLLRNGWYSENYSAGLPTALEHGVLLGAAGQGRIASAARADYAEAAAVVLTSEGQAGRVYELAGDSSYTLEQLAAQTARQSGKPLVYQNLSQEEYQAALLGIGLPEGFAVLLADSDAAAAKGALFDDGQQLSRLIGRGTTPIADSVAAALKG